MCGAQVIMPSYSGAARPKPAPGPRPAPAFDLRHTGDVDAVVGGVARLRCAVLHLAANTVSNSSIFTRLRKVGRRMLTIFWVDNVDMSDGGR